MGRWATVMVGEGMNCGKVGYCDGWGGHGL